MLKRSNFFRKNAGAHSGILRRLCALVCIILLCLYVSMFHFQLMLVQGDSMMPTYHSWEFVLLDKHRIEYQRGDVAAFRCDGLKSVLIKRIAAVPGDTVDIQNGIVLVNGQPEENTPETFPGDVSLPLTLSEGEYFLLGDNRAQSKDSRYQAVGIVNAKDLLGKAVPNKAPKAP